MRDERLDKEAIRELWADLFADAPPVEGDEPVYLTLPGGQALDIFKLIDRDLIRLTETNSIDQEDIQKLVAVESNNEAILALQRRLPGLRIKETHFGDLIRGDQPFAWPGKEDEAICRARIVNLDLNASLRAQVDQGSVSFPILQWISKLGTLHAKPPQRDWALCLTLNATLDLPDDAEAWAQALLRDNFDRDEAFGTACRDHWGDEVTELIRAQDAVRFGELSAEEQQAILQVFVPKVLLAKLSVQGWRIVPERSLAYGRPPSARMVSWIIRLVWDPTGAAEQHQVYLAGLESLAQSLAFVDADGQCE